MRNLYRCLLLMHPPAFRRLFEAELLWIFDECELSRRFMCRDCLVSVLRQWVLRSGLWRLATALFGACLQVTFGGLIWAMLAHTGTSIDDHPHYDWIALQGLVQWAVGIVLTTVILITVASVWLKSFIAARCDRTPRRRARAS